MGELAERVTGVVLDWRRRDNVRRIVAESPWRTLVFPSHAFTPDLGLYARFALGLLALTECVLIQDDDILLPASTVERLVSAWEERPEQLHGVFGRRPGKDSVTGEIKYDSKNVFGECEIVLTRVVMTSRKMLRRFFHHADEFADVQRESRPPGNGEDILLSYVARAHSQLLNLAHDLPRVELPAPDAIHARPGHGQHRTKLLRAICNRWHTT